MCDNASSAILRKALAQVPELLLLGVSVVELASDYCEIAYFSRLAAAAGFQLACADARVCAEKIAGALFASASSSSSSYAKEGEAPALASTDQTLFITCSEPGDATASRAQQALCQEDDFRLAHILVKTARALDAPPIFAARVSCGEASAVLVLRCAHVGDQQMRDKGADEGSAASGPAASAAAPALTAANIADEVDDAREAESCTLPKELASAVAAGDLAALGCGAIVVMMERNASRVLRTASCVETFNATPRIVQLPMALMALDQNPTRVAAYIRSGLLTSATRVAPLVSSAALSNPSVDVRSVAP